MSFTIIAHIRQGCFTDPVTLAFPAKYVKDIIVLTITHVMCRKKDWGGGGGGGGGGGWGGGGGGVGGGGGGGIKVKSQRKPKFMPDLKDRKSSRPVT